MRMEGTKIRDLRDGMICDGTYILKSAELRKTAAGKQYIDMTFLDETGEVNGKRWDAKEEDMKNLKTSRIYQVNVRVGIWQGNMQLTVNSIRPGDTLTQDRIMEFVPSAPESPENMMKVIGEFMDRIRNRDLQTLVREVYALYGEKLRYYPAAKALHHSIRGGYLYHIMTMLKSAEMIAGVYSELDTDLLYTGVLMHDVMKMEELDANELGIAEYSREGQLLGHIEMGISKVDEMAGKHGLDREVMLLVKHMILSHHYHPEYGSPKLPMFLEAEILHYIDLIDARVYDFNQYYATVEPGEFSEKSWALDRKVYRPKY